MSAQYLDWRNIKKETFYKYGVMFKCDALDRPFEVGYPYQTDTEPGFKVRGYNKKEFHSTGNMKDASLFGMDVFPAGSGDCIIITEGENDALAVHQMLNKPAVSVRGSSTAVADCRKQFKYLNSFDRIYLCFDNDKAGQAATLAVAQLFDNMKLYNIAMGGGHKDANDYLLQGNSSAFSKLFYDSKRFVPDNVVSSFADVDKALEAGDKEQLVSYPFEELQEMTYGIRPGEVTLITALEGQGKTEIVRAIEAHVLRTTDLNIGIIHLEESRKRSIQGLAGYELRAPVHLPGSQFTNSDVAEAYRKLSRRDERIHIINHFDDDDPKAALELIRFLVVKCECKVVFLDHISFMVANLDDKDERKQLDWLSTKLEKMTEELGFALVMISHVNDDGQTRGSRNIGKVANVRIDLRRDHLNTDPIERNKTTLTVSKNRFASTTGYGGTLYFDPQTFIVSEFREGLDDFAVKEA